MEIDIKLPEEITAERKPAKKARFQKAEKFKIEPYRHYVQLFFLALIIWIGIDFTRFVLQLQKGIAPTVSRPPGVEGFLPISALISLKYWLLTGVFNSIHPAALVLFLIFTATAVFMKKGFCGWICPFGLLSEMLEKLHIKLFDRRFHLPRWLDYPLRSLKYLLAFFFVWAVFVQMNVFDLQKFIYSPYNRVADIRMWQFFADMSSTTFWTLAILVALSFLIPHFWCRYLCPYGALLGALSWLSPLKIHRNENSCIDCGLCTKACPASIKVDKAKTVWSDECNACLRCVDACPVKDTLYLSVTRNRFKLSRKAYAVILVLLFLLGTGIARLTGHWKNSLSTQEYLYHIQHLEEPAYHHNRGQVPDYNPQEFSRWKTPDK